MEVIFSSIQEAISFVGQSILRVCCLLCNQEKGLQFQESHQRQNAKWCIFALEWPTCICCLFCVDCTHLCTLQTTAPLITRHKQRAVGKIKECWRMQITRSAAKLISCGCCRDGAHVCDFQSAVAHIKLCNF